MPLPSNMDMVEIPAPDYDKHPIQHRFKFNMEYKVIMTKYIIYTQVKEWYGDDAHIGDPEHGRYKNKGGQEFIFEGDEYLYMQDRELIKKFNAKYDRVGRFFRYEAKEIEFYCAPEQAKFVDGEIIIPFTDPMDSQPV